MGFLDSKTKQTVNQNTTTETNTTQTDQGNALFAFSDLGGGVAIDASDRSSTSVVNNTLDGGALKVAGQIAAGGLENARAANAGALEFGSQAISQLASANSDALGVFGGLVSGSYDFARDLSRDSQELASNALSEFSNFARESTADAVAGFGALAKQGSESSDDRVSKVALYALAAVAALVVLPQLFKGARA